ncbi:MAG: hypothetical protein HN353_04290 [Bdellovibrionales bacterium]|jgi:tRNA threonylcarbamoyladenosine biosynthesis protein TsaB|nr:hypothetical protein [Bdellovibrionales bacterium]MBT3526497.1 hypothetical protein [Bdellovibrionales bacterium]MBT7668077.1 hypothetical protein [Bdellovibrionales bacterium]MBT7767886.1 hypothetical protein [Bdellovibrionales bacterium]
MISLFLDTTDGLTVGILTDDFQWLDHENIRQGRCANKIHPLINRMLDNQGITIREVKGVFYLAGPGSYTGMRVGEGIAAIARWQNISVHSFYHFEVPLIALGVERGAWLGFAYKQEYFLYQWVGSNASSSLVTPEQLQGWLIENSDCPIYINSGDPRLIDLLSNCAVEPQLTQDIIHQQSQKLFTQVEKLERECPLHYYRPLEQEFKLPPPVLGGER